MPKYIRVGEFKMKVIIKPRNIEIIEAIRVVDNIDTTIANTENRKQEIVKEEDGIWLIENYNGEETINDRKLVVVNSIQKISLSEDDILTKDGEFYIVPTIPMGYIKEIDDELEKAVEKLNTL